jgi:hypothetical protein
MVEAWAPALLAGLSGPRRLTADDVGFVAYGDVFRLVVLARHRSVSTIFRRG